MVSIRPAMMADIPALHVFYQSIGKKEPGYFERCFQEHEEGKREIFLAEKSGEITGYVMLIWQPQYSLYKKLGIPEIQDLNVHPNYRRQGIGRALVEWCENVVKNKGIKEVGISVGLTSSYGTAQRLYVKMGYIPDGFGITYERVQVRHGEMRPLDDDLALMFLKHLGNDQNTVD